MSATVIEGTRVLPAFEDPPVFSVGGVVPAQDVRCLCMIEPTDAVTLSVATFGFVLVALGIALVSYALGRVHRIRKKVRGGAR